MTQALPMMPPRPSSIGPLSPPGTPPGIPPIETRGSEKTARPDDSNFVKMVKNVAKSTRNSLHEAEHWGKMAAAGQADPQVVATKTVEATSAVKQLSALTQALTGAWQSVINIAL